MTTKPYGLQPGDEVRCSNCHQLVYIVQKVIEEHEPLRADQFLRASGKPAEVHEPMRCSLCAHPFTSIRVIGLTQP